MPLTPATEEARTLMKDMFEVDGIAWAEWQADLVSLVTFASDLKADIPGSRHALARDPSAT